MSLLNIHPQLDPAEVFARLDAAIDEAKKIAGKADQLDLDALRAELDQLARASGLPPTRPGEFPSGFTAVLAAEERAPLDPAAVTAVANGKIYKIVGAGTVSLRSPVWLEASAFFALRVVLWRLADPTSPSNAPVDIGIQWLDRDRADAGQSLIKRYEKLKAADGPQFIETRVPSVSGAVPVLTPPAGAVSWAPYVRGYGPGGEIALQTMGVTEVTFAGAYVPDVTAIAAQLATIRGIIDAGLPLTTPILPSYAVASLPTPGSPGRKAFATDGRAPNAAGVLEGAGDGTGVEVTDNGSAWVITGTNQQVQA